MCGGSLGSWQQAESFNQTLTVEHIWGEDPLSSALVTHPGLALTLLLLLLLTCTYMWKGRNYAVYVGNEEEVRVLMRSKAELYEKPLSPAIPLRRYGTFRELPYHDA